MQTVNVNLPITVTGRGVSVTDSIRDYATKKIEGLHLDYPRIIEAKVLVDVQNYRQIAEIILFCANHITIEASTEHEDLYAAMDETISKIARRMRKYKTRLLKKQRPRKGSIRHLEEQVFSATAFDQLEGADSSKDEEEDHYPDVEPLIIHKEHYKLKPLYRDEAIMEMELSERPFVVFENANNHRLSILYRRSDGDYAILEPGEISLQSEVPQ